ncbi:MAG: Serine hydroxymethyltransferase [candidate division WS6 bacterium OLB20]|uniref:Serine hydroxymethyltransferase n=1 Tax=candidate division WS6 bacterium OLB20 TaxID=1617426 RepID=A0A136LWC8_9BACT|nr:MAG: Serine hydroxymethyltransferase [candidate division WS6 bacterium OLB20]
MIPSENFASKAVREAVGSVFMHKYSEGYPFKRYYEGNYNIDDLEELAKTRAAELFSIPDDWSVNVQALSGSPANLAVYLGLLKPGDTIMGMYLPDGGHLSHGWSYEPKEKQNPAELKYEGGSRKVNVTSQFYRSVQYKTDPETQLLDYDVIEKIALDEKPKLIVTGGTAYPREIDYRRMKAIAEKAGAYYLADIAHEAGLVSAGVNASPVGIADVVTFTTHKTLRASRGAIILGRSELMKQIDRAVFPGLQGGPHNHSIAGIAVGLHEAMQPEFKVYAQQVVTNAQTLAKALAEHNFSIVSGGTDKHLVLIDLTGKGVFGRKYARALDYAGIIANMNTMPQETRPPADPSALRVGTPWITTRGLKEEHMWQIADWMNRVMEQVAGYDSELEFEDFDKRAASDKELAGIADEVRSLCKKYPLEI